MVLHRPVELAALTVHVDSAPRPAQWNITVYADVYGNDAQFHEPKT